MSYNVVSSFSFLPSEPVNESATYPYLVVQIMASVYQRHYIRVYQGEASVEISHYRNFVRYSEPVTDNGTITPAYRTYLLDAVLHAVQSTRFRMAVVWGEIEASYVEPDGSIEEFIEPPTGGVSLPNKVAFDQQIEKDTSKK